MIKLKRKINFSKRIKKIIKRMRIKIEIKNYKKNLIEG
jgi:hypothetical protein